MAIRFFFEEISPLRSLQRNKVRKIVRKVIKDYSYKYGEINFVFVSDAYLLEMNRNFLNHDYYTDIITFPVYEGGFVNGDVFISTERVNENAIKYGLTFNDELLRVIIHGALHLCGMEDNTPKKKAKMKKEENNYLEFAENLE